MIEKTKPTSGFTDIFLSKLKEQSFVIMLMLGVIYYQHRLMEERVAFWQQEYDKKELYRAGNQRGQRNAKRSNQIFRGSAGKIHPR